ncbi:MAG: nicotinate-nucleotide adenylyltransferase [Alphaproteobacteria bacterium]|nr:nicotinate-nucleotide adenylyltransferase [Alphaproteobacteria bacterium]
MARFDPEVIPPEALALANAGARIGLLGGSFNPAHEAHLHISLIALRRLNLDCIWWLVSPQNPLKSADDMAPLARRLARAREVAARPNIFATTIETQLGTQFTFDTLQTLTQTFPKARFVWLMGGDNLASFHLWQRWEDIATLMPFAVIARPRFTTRALASPAAQHLRASRRDVGESAGLAEQPPPAWVFIQERLDPMSATAIRARGVWR